MRCLPRLMVRPDSFNTSFRSTREARQAGSKPKSNAVIEVRKTAKARTWGFMVTGLPGGSSTRFVELK